MSNFDSFRFDGKRVMVVGGATGMGAAAALLALEAGAEVVVMDHADIPHDGVTKIRLDLSEEASIDDALDACEGPVHALIGAAGVADGPAIDRINFLGHRHLITSAVERGLLGRGSAVCTISSAAGLAWESEFATIKGVLATTSMDDGAAWFAEHGWADYLHTKQVMCAWVAHAALQFGRKGVRINATCPGPTDTPLAQANAELWLTFGADYREEIGVGASTPLDQAFPLLFLCSDAARAINGITLISDMGLLSAGHTGAFPSATPLADMLFGRSLGVDADE